jgi:hypothetical protein
VHTGLRSAAVAESSDGGALRRFQGILRADHDPISKAKEPVQGAKGARLREQALDDLPVACRRVMVRQ